MAYATGRTDPVGSGRATVTIEAGKDASAKIDMELDPAYEAGLTEIYIHNEADLRRIGAAVNGLTLEDSDHTRTFYVENDIVLTQPWTPIGSPAAPFESVFDGQSHSITIKSFSGPIEESGTAHLGFFAYTNGGKIYDTKIRYELSTHVLLRNNSVYAGGIAGYATNTSFENIQVEGSFLVKKADLHTTIFL